MNIKEIALLPTLEMTIMIRAIFIFKKGLKTYDSLSCYRMSSGENQYFSTELQNYFIPIFFGWYKNKIFQRNASTLEELLLRTLCSEDENVTCYPSQITIYLRMKICIRYKRREILKKKIIRWLVYIFKYYMYDKQNFILIKKIFFKVVKNEFIETSQTWSRLNRIFVMRSHLTKDLLLYSEGWEERI